MTFIVSIDNYRGLLANDPAALDKARSDYPALAGLSNADLRTAYFRIPSSLMDILFKTPLGPVFILNIVAAATGFTWCDTPFGGAACPPV